MPKKKEDKHQIIEEGIPLPIRVKHTILDARDEAVSSFRALRIRQIQRKSTKTALVRFDVDVMGLYQLMREHFGEKDKIVKELDRVTLSGKKLKYKELCRHLNTLKEKIYKLKITKFEIRKVPDDRRF